MTGESVPLKPPPSGELLCPISAPTIRHISVYTVRSIHDSNISRLVPQNNRMLHPNVYSATVATAYMAKSQDATRFRLNEVSIQIYIGSTVAQHLTNSREMSDGNSNAKPL